MRATVVASQSLSRQIILSVTNLAGTQVLALKPPGTEPFSRIMARWSSQMSHSRVSRTPMIFPLP